MAQYTRDILLDPDPKVICTICLEPVNWRATKFSCHETPNCRVCVEHWMMSLFWAKKPPSCPRCRKEIDPTDTAPEYSTELDEFEEIEEDTEATLQEDTDEEFDVEDFDDEDFDDVTMFGSREDSGREDSNPKNGIRENSIHENAINMNGISQNGHTVPTMVSNPPSSDTFNQDVDMMNSSGKENIRETIEEVQDDSAPTGPLSVIERRRIARKAQIERQTLPEHEIHELLQRHAARLDVPWFMPNQTFFLPCLSYDIAILICATHHPGDGSQDVYYFWVQENTEIVHLKVLWMATEELEAPTETWSFEGKVLRGMETIGGSGMKHGSRLDIGKVLES